MCRKDWYANILCSKKGKERSWWRLIMGQRRATFTAQSLKPASNKFREQGPTKQFGVKTTRSTKSVWKAQHSVNRKQWKYWDLTWQDCFVRELKRGAVTPGRQKADKTMVKMEHRKTDFSHTLLHMSLQCRQAWVFRGNAKPNSSNSMAKSCSPFQCREKKDKTNG